MEKIILSAENFQLNIVDKSKGKNSKHLFSKISEEIILGQFYLFVVRDKGFI